MSQKLSTLLENTGFTSNDTQDTVDILTRSGAMRSTLGQLIRDLREENYQYVSYAPDQLKRASYLDVGTVKNHNDNSCQLDIHIKNEQKKQQTMPNISIDINNTAPEV